MTRTKPVLKRPNLRGCIQWDGVLNTNHDRLPTTESASPTTESARRPLLICCPLTNLVAYICACVVGQPCARGSSHLKSKEQGHRIWEEGGTVPVVEEKEIQREKSVERSEREREAYGRLRIRRTVETLGC